MIIIIVGWILRYVSSFGFVLLLFFFFLLQEFLFYFAFVGYDCYLLNISGSTSKGNLMWKFTKLFFLLRCGTRPYERGTR